MASQLVECAQKTAAMRHCAPFSIRTSEDDVSKHVRDSHSYYSTITITIYLSNVGAFIQHWRRKCWVDGAGVIRMMSWSIQKSGANEIKSALLTFCLVLS